MTGLSTSVSSERSLKWPAQVFGEVLDEPQSVSRARLRARHVATNNECERPLQDPRLSRSAQRFGMEERSGGASPSTERASPCCPPITITPQGQRLPKYVLGCIHIHNPLRQLCIAIAFEPGNSFYSFAVNTSRILTFSLSLSLSQPLTNSSSPPSSPIASLWPSIRHSRRSSATRRPSSCCSSHSRCWSR